jgi:DNA polymerase-3 subunit gamma/tau
MRDAESALDQVIAFAGNRVSVDDVSTVLGLVGRDLLFDLIDAVVEEDGPKAFALADRAVESGHDLKLVCRELSQVVRDMMMTSVDPARAGDTGLAEGERDRLTQLASRFSREDLMRAFDLLAKVEQDIRVASHPRYHFEMALLRWMHLRKLVPLADLMEQLGGGAAVTRGAGPAPSRAAGSAPTRDASPTRSGTASAASSGVSSAATRAAGSPLASAVNAASTRGAGSASTREASAAPARVASASPTGSASSAPRPEGASTANLKDTFLAEVRGAKAFFYNTVVAPAHNIVVTDERVTFTFLPTHRALREQFEDARKWLEPLAERVAGRKISVVGVQADIPAAPPASDASDAAGKPAASGDKRDLKSEAMASPAVQAVLDVFPAEIRDVEEM